MARSVKGDIVVVPFPFSDLTRSKRRPALVLAVLEGDDLILCQITGQAVRDTYAVPLDDSDLASGSLRCPSNVRPNRLFTADRSIILYTLGRLQEPKLNVVIKAVTSILRS